MTGAFVVDDFVGDSRSRAMFVLTSLLWTMEMILNAAHTLTLDAIAFTLATACAEVICLVSQRSQTVAFSELALRPVITWPARAPLCRARLTFIYTPTLAFP